MNSRTQVLPDFGKLASQRILAPGGRSEYDPAVLLRFLPFTEHSF